LGIVETLWKLKPRHFRFKLLMAAMSLAVGFALLEGLAWWIDVADPPIFQSHPAYGFLMQPNQSVATRGKRFRINRAGLRGEDFAMPKPPGTLRIAFLGDSVTYGGGSVRDEDLFVNRVVGSLDPLTLPRLEAVNISAPGWGVSNMAGFVNAVGLFDSNLLVWVISAADLRRPYTELAHYRFLAKKPMSRVYYAAWTSAHKLVDAVRRARQSPARAFGRVEVLEENVRVLRATLAQLRAKSVPVAVVLVPGVRGYDSRQDVARFRDAAEDCATPFLDTAAAFTGKQLRAAYIDDIHLSAQGHAIVAGAIGPFLGEHFFFPRQPRASGTVPAACLAPQE
jgi:lysophospholipase L1-like esterase